MTKVLVEPLGRGKVDPRNQNTALQILRGSVCLPTLHSPVNKSQLMKYKEKSHLMRRPCILEIWPAALKPGWALE